MRSVRTFLSRRAMPGRATRMIDALPGFAGEDPFEERLRRLTAIDDQIASALAAPGGPWGSAVNNFEFRRPNSAATKAAGLGAGVVQARLTPPVEVEREERRRRAGGGGGAGLGGARKSAAGRAKASASSERPGSQRPPMVVKAGLAAGSQVAVVKLASYASGRASMGALVNYQSRGGDLALEREDGSSVEGKAALTDLVATWAAETNSRAPSKDSLAFAFSFSEPRSEGAIGGGLGEAFEGHRYAWRAEPDGEGMNVLVVLSAASSRRDEMGRPTRIFDNRKSLARFQETIKATFGEEAKIGPPSWSHGPEGMARQMREASLRGALPLATPAGKSIDSPEAAREMAQSWKRDLRSQNPRDTAHIIISAKPGTPREAFVDAARATLATEFAGHKYAFALHSDRAHLHVHAIVRMDNALGRRLDPNIGDFKRWRETMASHARERNIAMEPTSRFDQALTPAYKLGDVNALARGTPTESQRRRVEARQTRAVHVPTREEGVERAQANAREWRQLPDAGRRFVQGEPPVPVGHLRLYRAERVDAPSSAPLYSTTRGAAGALASQSGGRLIYLDVPESRRGELTPSNRNPGLEFVVSKSLASLGQAVPQDATILSFRDRAEAALAQTRDHAPSGAIDPNSGAQDMRSAAAMSTNLREIAETVRELSQLLPEAQREKLLTLGAEFEAKGSRAIASQRKFEEARPYAEGPYFDAPTPQRLRLDLQGFTTELKAGEVRYSQIDEKIDKPVVAFVDNGKTVTIHNPNDERAVRAALHVASEKWGTLTLTGTAAFKTQAVQIAAEKGYAITNPELQEQLMAARARIESQREPAPVLARGDGLSRGDSATPVAPVQVQTPPITPTTSALALEQNRVAIEREAARETREASAARAQGEVNPAESRPETPYRPAAEAASARDAARAVDQGPNQSIPVEATQSQAMRNLSAEREQELTAQRYADAAKRHAQEDAQKAQEQNRDGGRERDDGQER